jgi:cardiolipin synthase
MGARDHLTKFRWRRRKPVEIWVGGNRVNLFTQGDLAFERMLEAIRNARQSVWLEMYWFAADGVGMRFFEALDAAARRGVRVAILYDAWGSFATPRQHFERLRAAGAAVVEFNPISLIEQRFRVASLTRRNHRKLLIADGEIAFTGGLNIADEWTASAQGKRWKDEVVEVTGPVVRNLQLTFLDSWREQSEEDTRRGVPPPSLSVDDEATPHSDVSGVNVAVLTQSGLRQRRYAMRAYLQRLRAATETINIANAYFLPNPTLVRCLVAAAKRGVRVRVVVAGKSDVPVVTLASRAVWPKLLRAGVELYAWRQTVLHSKLAVVDGAWVTAGSFNLDYVSMRRNRELNLAIGDTAFAEQVNAEFDAMVAVSEPVTQAVFHRRPLVVRLLERLAYAFRSWL